MSLNTSVASDEQFPGVPQYVDFVSKQIEGGYGDTEHYYKPALDVGPGVSTACVELSPDAATFLDSPESQPNIVEPKE